MAEAQAKTMGWGQALLVGLVATAVLVVLTVLFELVAGGSFPSWGH